MPSTASRWTCPNCSNDLDAAAAQSLCPRCGMHFTGQAYGRFVQVIAQLRTLGQEREALVATLTDPSYAPEGTAVRLPSLAPAPAQRSGSGQRLALGLGALLLLAGMSVFLLVSWFLLGATGQALMLAALTVATVPAARLATRRGLTEAAATAEVIGVGLVLVDLNGARSRNLFGLGLVDGGWYWTIGFLVAAILAVLSAVALPRPRVWPTAAAAAVVGSVTAAYAVVEPEGIWWIGAAAVGTLLLAALARMARRLLADLRRGPEVTLTAGAAAWALVWLVAALVHGFDLWGRESDRLVASGWLVGVGVATVLVAKGRKGAAVVGIALAGLGLLVPLSMVSLATVVAVQAAVTIGAVALMRLSRRWLARSLTVVASVAVPALVAVVWLLADRDTSTVTALLRDQAAPLSGPRAAYVLPLVAALVWVAHAALSLTAPRTVLPRRIDVVAWRTCVLLVSLAVAATLACLHRPPTTQLAIWGGLALLLVGTTTRLAHRRVQPTPTMLTLMGGLAATGVALSVIASPAMTHAGDWWSAHQSLSAGLLLVVVGVLVALVATAPGWVRSLWAGGLVTASGIDLLVLAADLHTVEAFSLPAAALLLGIGGWLHRRQVATSSMEWLSPGLSLAVLPTTLAVVTGGDQSLDTVRLVALVAAGIVGVVVGDRLQLRAPVLLGAVVLCLLALTRGGPYLDMLPWWLTLTAGGVVLLTVGVRWEAAAAGGRRASAWWERLR